MLIGVLLLFVFLILGMPVAFALLSSGAIGLFVTDIDSMFSILTTAPYRTAASFTLSTIPLFIFMAEILARGGFAKDLYKACYIWIGHLSGGLAISSVLASALMGAMSGSTTATAAAMSRIAIPEMDRYGYNRRISTGVIAFGGTIAIMIPPSIPLVIYGILTENSIGKLLIAGILPGILTAIILCIAIYLRSRLNPTWTPLVKPYSWKERFKSLSSLWSVLLIIIIVIGSIYTGFATATESAALGATGATLIGIITRRLNFRLFLQALRDTIKTTSMIFLIIIGAMVFGYYLTITGASNAVIDNVTSLPLPSFGILLVILLIYLILGFFMDGIAILLLTLPLTYPIISSLGYDPIWFGILVIFMGEIGLVTPPLGLNAFIVSSISKEPIENVFKGVTFFLVCAFLILVLLVAFPGISTWLPSNLKG
jgi:C4-dicarboxylate transporter, DctM subunit